MKTVLGLAALLIAVGLGVLGLQRALRGAQARRVPEAVHPPADAERETGATVSPVAERESVEAPDEGVLATEVGPDVAGGGPSWVARGLVYTWDSRLPVAAVRVRATTPGSTAATSAADGTFEVRVREQDSALVADDPAWATVRAGSLFDADFEGGHWVLVAPRIDLAGRVVDAAGLPVRGVEVSFDSPAVPAAAGTDPEVLKRTQRVIWRALSDDDGRFDLPALPALERAELQASSTAHRPYSAPAPVESRADLEIVLESESAGPVVLRGVVRTPDGAPAAGAEVELGSARTRADPAGEFALTLTVPSSLADVLRASAEGYLPVEKPLTEADRALYQELVLGPPAGGLVGRVLDAEGQPEKGATVCVFALPEAGLEPLETQTTRVDGAFHFPALPEGQYAVWVVGGRQTSFSLRLEVAPGAGELVVTTPSEAELALHPSDFSGFAVDEAGGPLAGVSVRTGPARSHTARLGTTDDAGAFALERVAGPWTLVELSLPGRPSLVRALGPGEPRAGATWTLPEGG